MKESEKQLMKDLQALFAVHQRLTHIECVRRGMQAAKERGEQVYKIRKTK